MDRSDVHEYQASGRELTKAAGEVVEKSITTAAHIYLGRRKKLKVDIRQDQSKGMAGDVAKVRALVQKGEQSYESIHSSIRDGPTAKASKDPEHYADMVMQRAFQKDAIEAFPVQKEGQSIKPSQRIQ